MWFDTRADNSDFDVDLCWPRFIVFFEFCVSHY